MTALLGGVQLQHCRLLLQVSTLIEIWCDCRPRIDPDLGTQPRYLDPSVT